LIVISRKWPKVIVNEGKSTSRDSENGSPIEHASVIAQYRKILPSGVLFESNDYNSITSWRLS